VTDFTDQATGAFLEDALRHLLLRETSRATRYQDFFSLCLIAPDGTEPGNGSDADLRQAICGKIAQFVRSTDLVGHLQGRIAVVLLHTAGPDTVRVADRIRSHIEKVAFPASATGGSRQVTLSIGAVSFPRDGYSHSSLLTRAEVHLVEAARQGGNRIVYSKEGEG
jgi:diguanylate cyclase (GGDEF)-like protein